MKLPEEIVVGFKYIDSNLSFITYYKSKDELAKQNSFDSWRNKNVDIKTFNNEPITGHKLLEFVGGDSYSHSRLAQAQIEDPRGFSFEIKVDNLMELLKNANLIGQKLDGKYVYGWDGTELQLIDVNSEVYKTAKHRDILTKYDPKDCIPGEYYNKEDNDKIDYLFLGKLKCLYFIDKHIREKWLDFKHEYYPEYKYYYIFKCKYSWNNSTHYEIIASSKLTKKFLKSDKVFDGDLKKELEEFYIYDHNTISSIEYNMTKFNRFEIDEKYKCTSLNNVPVRTNDHYNTIYAYIDNDYLKYVCYRNEKNPDLINFKHYLKIKQDGNNSYIEKSELDFNNVETVTLQELIGSGKFYIFSKAKEISNNPIVDLYITDGKQKLMFNEFKYS